MTEEVVLLDAQHRPAGTMDKSQVHGAHTPLHLAFSCYIRNAQGEILLTRRSLNKIAWPGVWTNSVCGHPAPGESLPDAVRRRSLHELGLAVEQVHVQIAEFQYCATDASGIVENEFCPIFLAITRQRPILNPQEVMDSQWVTPENLLAAVMATPAVFSPWMVEQLSLMTAGNLSLTGQNSR